jgi:hypothetical protein
MLVAPTAQQTSKGLVAVGRDMAKILAIIAPRKTGLNSAKLYLDDNMVETIQTECLLRFYISC